MEDITNIVNRLATKSNDESRRKLIDGLRDLSYTLESPHDSLQRIMFSHLQIAAVRIGVRLKLFDILASARDPMNVEQLQHLSGAAPLLLGRLLRYFASFRFIQDVGQDLFTSNNVTRALATPGYQAGLIFLFDTMGPVWQAFPDFLASTNYQDISDDCNTAFQVAHKTSLAGIPWVQEHPQAAASFNDYMAFHRKQQPSCWDAYPVAEEASECDHNAVVLVDIGGSLGHQCADFKRHFPDIPGRVVLQDLQGPISTAMSTPGVENMAHDMFTPQPIKGAKFYYLRNILHDWPDHKCCDILRSIIGAMSPSSIILIDEMVLPDEHVHWQAAQSDLATLAGLGASERTEQQWTELLGCVDLRVQKRCAYSPSVYQSMMEVVRKGRSSDR